MEYKETVVDGIATKIVRLKIPRSPDRRELVSALASAGYKVWVERESLPNDESFVCFDLKRIEDIKKKGAKI